MIVAFSFVRLQAFKRRSLERCENYVGMFLNNWLPSVRYSGLQFPLTFPSVCFNLKERRVIRSEHGNGVGV